MSHRIIILWPNLKHDAVGIILNCAVVIMLRTEHANNRDLRLHYSTASVLAHHHHYHVVLEAQE